MKSEKVIKVIWITCAIVLLIGIARDVLAFQVCWAAPTENVDGTPADDLAYLTLYYGNEQEGNYAYTRTIEPPADGCINVRVSRGIWYMAMTATDHDGNRSGFSNWISKEENRLRQLRGGRLLGPSEGRILN